MVLPLIALAGAALAKPHLDAYSDRIGTNAQNRRLDAALAQGGFDLNDPNQSRNALLRAGMLSGGEFQGDARSAYENQANRLNQLQRTRISSGPAYMNAQLAQRQYEDRQAAAAAQRQAREAALDQLGVPQGPLRTMDGYTDKIFEQAGINAQDRLAQDFYAANPGPRNFAEGMDLARLQVDEDAAAADAWQAMQDRELQFQADRQALIDQDDRIIAAQQALPQTEFAAQNWTDEDARRANMNVNRALDVIRSDVWLNELRRTDAPAAEEVERLLQRIPEVSDGWWTDDARRADIEYILDIARRQVNVRGNQLEDRYARRPARSYSAQNMPDVPTDWRN